MKHFTFFSGLKLAAKAASLALITGLFAAPATAEVLNGSFTIQQKSNNRYLDAYQGGSSNAVVTRGQQSNDTQVWTFTHKGGNKYTIRQKSNGLFLDSFYTKGGGRDGVDVFSVVTRASQNNGSQIWSMLKNPDGSYRIQSSNGRSLEAFEGVNDFAAQANSPNNTQQQRWIVKPVLDIVLPPLPLPIQLSGTYYIQQRSNNRYMDAHQGSNDNSAVTRPFQNNATQRWVISPQGNDIYTIRQRSSMMFLDAHEGINDNDVVTRNAQNNTTQQWIIKRVNGNIYTIQQRSNGRYLDAHGTANKDFRVVTRNQQNNATQKWVIKLVP